MHKPPRRQKWEVWAEVLSYVEKEPSPKTRIMYQANLSFIGLKNILNELLKIGFLTTNSPYYSITDRGREFLQRYRELLTFVEDRPLLMLNNLNNRMLTAT